jgi:hypothetical protein
MSVSTTLSEIESKFGTSMASMDRDQAVSVPLWSRNTKDLTYVSCCPTMRCTMLRNSKPEVARTNEYIASLKLSRGSAIWQLAYRQSAIDLEKATAIFDKGVLS